MAALPAFPWQTMLPYLAEASGGLLVSISSYLVMDLNPRKEKGLKFLAGPLPSALLPLSCITKDS